MILFESGHLCQYHFSVLQLQLFVELRPILTKEMYHLIGLAFVTELFDLFGCHLMAVDGSPNGELAFHVLVAVVGTVIGSCTYSYLTAALRTLADGRVEHHFSLYSGREQRREMLACLGTETVENLFLASEEVFHFLLCNDPVTDTAADEEVAVVVILLKEVLTGIALAGHFDSSSTDRATALQVTGRKCQLHFSFLDDELSRKGLSFFVLHLEFASLTGFQ